MANPQQRKAPHHPMRAALLLCSLAVLALAAIGASAAHIDHRRHLSHPKQQVLELDTAVVVSAPVPPLSTRGTQIVDGNGSPVQLHCVNWSGAEEKDFVSGGLSAQTADSIAATIAGFGFNCVRLLFSVEAVANNPPINPARITKVASTLPSPAHAMDVFDLVVEALTNAKLMVILDNHMSKGDWCCSGSDGNGLFYTDVWPESAWLAAWKTMASRYKHNALVVGAELRNEPRDATVGGRHLTPTWASGDTATDFKLAFERAGAVVQAANPDLLVLLDGLMYATHLEGVRAHPAQLPVGNKTVYVAHDYSWFHNGVSSYAELEKALVGSWAYLVDDGLAPVVVTEFGTPNDGSQMGSGSWWAWFLQFLKARHLSWAYWRVDGTESNGTSRPFGQQTGFGILNTTWDGPVHNGILLHQLQQLMAK